MLFSGRGGGDLGRAATAGLLQAGAFVCEKSCLPWGGCLGFGRGRVCPKLEWGEAMFPGDRGYLDRMGAAPESWECVPSQDSSRGGQ